MSLKIVFQKDIGKVKEKNMPNWCSNEATFVNDDVSKVDGLEAQVKKQQEVFKDPDSSETVDILNYLIPNPAGEWDYGWSIDNWGTKWDVNVYDYERIDENTLMLRFDSAWGAPTTLYENIQEDGWDVDAMFEEPGMSFVGSWSSSWGEEFVEYDFSDPDWRQDINEDLIEYANLDQAYEDWKEWQDED
jgi:hypothetical protein